MTDTSPDWETLFVDLATGERTLAELDQLEHALAADPSALAELQRLRRQLSLLKHLPSGPELATSVVVPSEDPNAGRLDPELEARVKGIFAALGAGSNSARAIDRADTSSDRSSQRNLRHLIPPPSIRWVARAFAAAAALLLVAVPAWVLVLAPLDTVIKGDGEDAAPSRAPASLSLVERASSGEIQRLPLEQIADDAYGVRLTRSGSVLPVVMSREVDLSKSPYFVRLVLIDERGHATTLIEISGANLRRLPGTDHLYVPSAPLSEQTLRELPSGLHRLYALMTEQALSDEEIEDAVSSRPDGSVTTPHPLLDPTLSHVNGLEATLLVEVP